jgi:hypothetical protein
MRPLNPGLYALWGAAALALTLASPGSGRAASVPFLVAAQEHHAGKGKEAGVVFHVTAKVDGVKGAPCTLVVYVFDKAGKPVRARAKGYADRDGRARTQAAFTPQYDFTLLRARLFLPYSAFTAGAGAQAFQAVGNVWQDGAGKYLAVRPYKAALSFNPTPTGQERQRARGRFLLEQKQCALALRLHDQYRQAQLRQWADRRRQEQRQEEERRRQDRVREDKRLEDQRYADRLYQKRLEGQRYANRLYEERRAREEEQRRRDAARRR